MVQLYTPIWLSPFYRFLRFYEYNFFYLLECFINTFKPILKAEVYKKLPLRCTIQLSHGEVPSPNTNSLEFYIRYEIKFARILVVVLFPRSYSIMPNDHMNHPSLSEDTPQWFGHHIATKHRYIIQPILLVFKMHLNLRCRSYPCPTQFVHQP